ncbi:MAG: endopeptidase La [Bacilli bacterium]
MLKTDLPVIILPKIILLPNNEVRLEFDNNINKNIIEIAKLFHNNKILIVSNLDLLEEEPNLKKLSKIGVIAKINHKIELPNGKTRVIFQGIKRAKIYEYLNLNRRDELLEAIVSEIEEEKIDATNETIFTNKLYRELEKAIKKIPYLSNTVLSLITNVNNLSKMTDIIVPHLPSSCKRGYEYLKTSSPNQRFQMILEDIYQEMEQFSIENKIDNKIKDQIDHNQKEYLLREKLKFIKEELGEISTKETEIEIINKKISELKAPLKIKERIKIELQRYESLSSMSSEISLITNYIDWLLELPWQIYTNDVDDFNKVKTKLNESHYGLEKVKTRIIEFLAVKKMTNNMRAPIICLVGPPGVGKTSLAISIASAINRNFVKMSVGGINDEAEIIGHRKTYLGSSPGRIIQSMKKAKSSNPVFLIDEIDKMTKDLKGDPASALLEILDPKQNKYFSDNYIEEEYDLSNVMFIATANYINDIPEALKDRLEIVHLSSYTEYEKLHIGKNHLIRKVCQEHGINKKHFNFTDEAILTIIRCYTKEAGVRELERQIAKIVRKVVTSLIVNNIKINVINITEKNLLKYLGKKKYHLKSSLGNSNIGVVTGLAYTYCGGDTLSIEVTFYQGKGDLILTGSLGEVMKESAQIALSYIKANSTLFKINKQLLNENDIHLHVPEGAVPKDGPSAGITITTALISALINKPVDNHLAMTGEITLRGKVLPIGGLKEKSIGAHRFGIKTIIIPKDNLNDLEEVPSEIKKDINYLPVTKYDQIYDYIFANKKEKR